MTMSYPSSYQQFVDYSNPGTPRVYSWQPAEQDAMQMPQQQEQQTMQQHQQQQQLEDQQAQERVSPSQLQLQQLPPPTPLVMIAQDIQQPQVPPQPQQQRRQQGQYEPHQPTIALQAPNTQPQYRFDITTEEHFMQQAQADARPGSSSSRRGGASKPPPLHVDTSRASSVVSPSALSSAGAGAGPLRAPQTRAHAQSAHPYRRPQSRAASGSSTGRDCAGGAAPAPVRSRRVSELQSAQTSAGGASRSAAPVVGTAMAVSCPGADTWREGLLGLSGFVGASHDPEATPSATPRPQQHVLPAEPVRRYGIRADVHYSTEENLMIAMFELPGVKRSDLRITIGACPFSGVRQINIVGISRSPLPMQGHGVRERKFGHFMRALPVPPETKPEDVAITLEDGILTLKIPGGAPAPVEEPQEIAIP